MTAYITVSDADNWQPIAQIYVNVHELVEGDKFAVWHFLTWTQSIADNYEREFGRDARKIHGIDHYVKYVAENAKKGTP